MVRQNEGKESPGIHMLLSHTIRAHAVKALTLVFLTSARILYSYQLPVFFFNSLEWITKHNQEQRISRDSPCTIGSSVVLQTRILVLICLIIYLIRMCVDGPLGHSVRISISICIFSWSKWKCWRIRTSSYWLWYILGLTNSFKVSPCSSHAPSSQKY